MADSKIQIQVEVVGADKANKQIQSLENSSVDLKDGVKGVGENFKSVGDLVRSQGGIMGDAFGTLGDSVIAVTDSVFVFKEGMATAGATGAKAWIGLLGPISAVVGAIALAVEAYRQFSGSSQEAEDNLENMASAASDTASRLEAMVEAGIELSSDALREFIKVNEKARLAIEQVIKINEKRATSQLRVTQAEKDLNDAQKSTLFTETRVALAKSELISAQKEYNKLLDEQTAKSKEANKAQKESYELEQLITNELQFYIDEYQSQIDAQKDNLETTIKLTDAKNKDYLITLGTNTLQKQASEEILKATKVQKIYDDLLKRGQITQSAYDDVVKRNKQTLKEMTDNLKEVNNEQKNNLTLTEANVNLQRANDNQNKKAVVSTGSFTSAIDKRISKMEELTRIEKEYLSNFSKQLQLENLLKETVLGGSDAIQKRKVDALQKMTAFISKNEKENLAIQKLSLDELKKMVEQSVSDITHKVDRVPVSIVIKDNKPITKERQEILDRLKLQAIQKDAFYKNQKVITDNVNVVYTIYKEHYASLNELSKLSYEMELKDLNDQEAKLNLNKKKNKDNLLQIKKKKDLAEQAYLADQVKIQLQFEQETTQNLINLHKDRLDTILKMKQETADKETQQLELQSQKEQISKDRNLQKQISDYKKTISPIFNLFYNTNAKIEKMMEEHSSIQIQKTLETEVEKAKIIRKSIDDQIAEITEFTDESGKLIQSLKANIKYVQLIPSINVDRMTLNEGLKEAQNAYEKLASEIGKEVGFKYIDFQMKIDPKWMGPNGATSNTQLVRQIMGGLDLPKGVKELPADIKKVVDQYSTQWNRVVNIYDTKLEEIEKITGEKDLGFGYKFKKQAFPIISNKDAMTALSTLRDKYKIDTTKDIESQVKSKQDQYQIELENLKYNLQQQQNIINENNMKIAKSNEDRANKDIETQRQEYDTVRGYLYDMTDAYAQTASANIATAFYQGESIKEALKNTLQSLAIESTSKAIYETAAGLASLAIPGMQASAGLHFKAAAMYGSVALLAGVGTKLAPPSAGGSSTTSTSPTGNAQGSFNNRPSEDKGQTQNFYINFGGSVIYDTKASAERAMANRIMSLGTQSSRGQARSIQFRDR